MLLVVAVAAGKVTTAIETDQNGSHIGRARADARPRVRRQHRLRLGVGHRPQDQAVATLDSRALPIRAQFTGDGKHVLVSNAQSGDVAVFDAASRRAVRRIKMQPDASSQGPVPVGILIVPTLSRVFVANTDADTVTAIDLHTWQIVDRRTAGKEPDGLGHSPLTL
jgi:DNA-binding beta-propeller fold protein YncE